MTKSADLDVVELIEDELLLSLPTSVCIDAGCVQRPKLAYGDAAAEDTQTENPFGILEKLKRKP